VFSKKDDPDCLPASLSVAARRGNCYVIEPLKPGQLPAAK